MSAEVLQLERAAPAPHRRQPIELAHEPPFELGELKVAPALRELAFPDGRHQSLEPRVMQVLVALARAGGATVSRDELIRTCWNGTIVGDDSINRTISLLRRTSDAMGSEAFRIETIPRVGYRLVCPASDPARTVEPPPVRARAASRRLRWAAIAVLLVVLAAALTIWPAAPKGPAYSISVRPFRIAGAAKGFDDELLSALTKLDIPTAAGRAGLTLAGSIAEEDGSVSVHARLIDSESDELVWSGAIRHSTMDPGGLTSAAAIVGNITHCTLAGGNDAGSRLPLNVPSRYARACELVFRQQSAEGLKVARELARDAPDFAAGWFALSQHALGLYLSQAHEDDALRTEALMAAEKLIELRPRAQDGYAQKALALDPARPIERERLLRRAARMEPIFVDGAQSYLGDFLLQAGRFEEAFQLHRAVELQNPEVAIPHARVFLAAAATGRWPIVDQALERVRQLDPPAMPNLLWRKAVWEGDWAEAERLVPLELPAQEKVSIATYRALASGDTKQKEAAARLVLALPADCCVHLRIEMLTQLGRTADAIALLEKFDATRTPARRPGNVGLLFLSNPALRPLWYDPAIEPFFSRNGWIEYWRANKTQPDLCAGERPPSFCRLLSD